MALPENKPKEFNKTPRIFLIWGQSMSGKTYLARQFPNPIILSTDGNAAKVDTPSMDITSFEQFVNAIEEIEEGKHTFETVIIDLVDDIAMLLNKYVCDYFKIDSLGSNPKLYSRDYAMFNNMWKALMMRLSSMKYNVIFISHIVEGNDGDTQIQLPSLPQKQLNGCKGRCDAYIKCSKIGSTYIQKCEERRDEYVLADIIDSKVSEALKNVKGLFNDVDNKPVVNVVKAGESAPKADTIPSSVKTMMKKN